MQCIDVRLEPRTGHSTTPLKSPLIAISGPRDECQNTECRAAEIRELEVITDLDIYRAANLLKMGFIDYTVGARKGSTHSASSFRGLLTRRLTG